MHKTVGDKATGEAKRLATVCKVQKLLPGDARMFDGMCRIATQVMHADASVVAFMGEYDQVFLGRDGVSVGAVPRSFPISLLQQRLIHIADLRDFDGSADCPLVDGRLDSFRGALSVPITFEGQPVGLMSCYFRTVLDGVSPDAVARLADLAGIVERLIVQEAALTAIARAAVLAIDGTTGD
ncbi:MAG: hypothetical protein RIR62_357 [Pseudomonadota bacterium]